MIYSSVYSRSTTYFICPQFVYLSHLHLIQLQLDYGQISNKHPILRAVFILGAVEASTYFDASGNDAALIWGPVLIRGNTVVNFYQTLANFYPVFEELVTVLQFWVRLEKGMSRSKLAVQLISF